MSGKTAGGLVLVVLGLGIALWGINLMHTFGQRLGRAIGMHDNTGPLAIGVGALLAVIGLVLALSKRSRAKG